MAESYQMVENWVNQLYSQPDLLHEQKVAINYLLAAAKEMTKVASYSQSYLLEKIEKFLSYVSDAFSLPDLAPAQFFKALIMAGKLKLRTD